MSSRRPRGSKRPNRRTSSSAARRKRAAGPSPHQLAGELVRSYAGLATEPDPMQLEMTASALCEPGIAYFWDSDEDDAPTPPMTILALLEHVRERELADDALALATALGTLPFGDHRTAELADRVTQKLRFLGGRPSPATRLVGTARATAAWAQSDSWGDQLQLSIGYEYPGAPDQPAHTLTMLIDSNLGSIKDIWLAPPIDEFLAHVRESLGKLPYPDSQVMQLREVTLEQACDILCEATEWGDMEAWHLLEDPDARDLIGLVDARCDALLDEHFDPDSPRSQTPDWHLRPSDLDSLDERGLADHLLASDEFAAERDAGANDASAFAIASFVEGYIEGGKARFGPDAAQLALLHHAPTLTADDATRDALRSGLAPTARAWARLTHRVLDLPTAALDAVLAELERVSDLVDDALDGSLAPSGDGFAARLAAQMEREGVDFTDPAQVDAFMNEFNNRSFEERSRILDGE